MNAIANVAKAVEAHLKHESSGHDWQHIYRVWQTAQKLAAEEGANTEVVNLAALLHDVDDRKLTGDPTSEDLLPTVRKILQDAGADGAMIETVCTTIKSTGYAKSLAAGTTRSLEAHILSDADHLDGIGAVGIARVFTYGGSKSRFMFNPDETLTEHHTRESYAKSTVSSTGHFFEKLLKLRTLMHTASGKAEAEIRHQRMVTFLNDFFEEAAAPQIWKDLLQQYR